MNDTIKVNIRCKSTDKGDIAVTSCETSYRGVLHRVRPDHGILLASLVDVERLRRETTYRAIGSRVTRHSETALFAGMRVNRLTWIDGAAPMVRFEASLEEFSSFLSKHFGKAPLPRDHAESMADQIFEQVLLPVLNVSSLCINVQNSAFPDVRLDDALGALYRRIAGLELLVNNCTKPAELLGGIPNPKAGPVLSRSLETLYPDSRASLQLIQPEPGAEHMLHSFTKRRGLSQHRQSFPGGRTLRQAFGRRLGDLLEENLTTSTRPVQSIASPDLEYVEPGFAFRGATIHVAEAPSAKFHRAASVFMSFTQGVPETLQAISPWNEDRPGPLTETEVSLQHQLLLTLEASRDLLDCIANTEITLLTSKWVRFKQGHLWFLSSLIGRNLTLELDRHHAANAR